jgi:hypothetical protein
MAIVPQFSKLLEGCRDMAVSHLRPLMESMFENADVALLEFAEKAESNMAQSVFFDAMSEARKKRDAMEQEFFRQIDQSFSLFPTRPEAPSAGEASADSSTGLSLVDRNTMETSVAMLNASGKLSTRVRDKVFGLKQRLAVVNGGASIEDMDVPAGPAWLAGAYRRAIEHLAMQNEVRVVFIALYEKYVLNRVDGFFDEFNERLVQAGILPHLHYEFRRQSPGTDALQTDRHNPAAQIARTPSANGPHANDSSQSVPDLGDELFGRILTLMTNRSSPAGTEPSEAQDPEAQVCEQGSGAPAAPPGPGGSAFLDELSRLQSITQAGTAHLSSAEFIENLQVDETLVERLQSTLAKERARLFGRVDKHKSSTPDTNVIELVGMLFEYMLREEHLPNVVKALLSRLHTPLLKAAVMDRTFFTNTQHPARKLLNDMTAAGIRWVEENNIERGIFPKMKDIVDRVLLEFEEDSAIFELFVHDFHKATEELKQRARLVERRNAEAADGQDKLQSARDRARREINGLMAATQAGDAAREFLQRIWADRLTFVLLRNPAGDQCAEWEKAVSLAERVVDSVVFPRSEDARRKRHNGLRALQEELRKEVGTMQHADKEKLLSRLFESQTRALEEVQQTAREEVSARPSTAPRRSETPAREEDRPLTPAQRDTITKLNQVPFGTWFEFRCHRGAPAQRAKLSWRSTISEKFMFVDQMGIKAAVISMHELADFIIEGKVRMLKEEKKPFVDRALHAIHRMLDHGTRQKASA